MKNTTFTITLLLFSISLNAQISIAEFRKLEDKVNGLVTENQNLRTEVANLKSSLSQLKQTNSSQNSSIDNNRRSLDERVQQVETSVNQKIISLEQSVATSIEDAEEKTEKALTKLNNVLPVGSIVAYQLDITKIPSNWALCDGKPVTDRSSIYFNYSTPNLSGYFIRGKTSSESVGDTGGNDREPSHYHGTGHHTHNFRTNDSWIAPSHWCGQPGYGLQCQPGGSLLNFVATHNEAEMKKLTSHHHSGTTEEDAPIGHSGETSSSGESSNIPEYKAFNYIIKIK